MATVRLIQDLSAPHEDGTAPIKLVITKSNRVSRISLGVSVLPKQWSSRSLRVVKHPTADKVNQYILQRYCDAQMILLNNPDLPFGDIRAKVMGIAPDNDTPSFLEVAGEVVNDEYLKASTRQNYKYFINIITEFMNGKELKWEDMNAEWGKRFDCWLMKRGLMQNTRCMYIRQLKAVASRAMKQGYIDYHPFSQLKTPRYIPARRAMTVEQLRGILFAKLSQKRKNTKRVFLVDMYKLMFYLRGISVKDMCYLKSEDYNAGKIYYNRFKTGKTYCIKVEPEIKEIIDKYHKEGDTYLLPILSMYSNYVHFDGAMNYLGRQFKFRDGSYVNRKFTTYWLRHSWATIAINDLDIPVETVSAGLGHAIGNHMTSVYVDFDQRKADEANRKIIDYVKYGMK